MQNILYAGIVTLMCGITGFIGEGTKEILASMCDSLHHRGPDESGEWIDVMNSVFFGHKRLSIVDLASGQQPMLSSNGDIVIIFNGEIYNHQELRTELVKRNHKFITHHSDTETLIYAYKEWGPNFVEKLNGMWAFVIYDKIKKRLFCSRDRFGKKPFFYTFQDGNLVFASEITAIKKYPHIKLVLSKKSLQKYFAYGYTPAPNTIYENVYKLPGGCNLTYDIDTKELVVSRYWDFHLEPFDTFPKNPGKEWGGELQFLLDRAVKRRLMSDVPLGVFLSGGLDSSSIVALASRHVSKNSLQTFSIGFDEKSFDETQYARQVASMVGCTHHMEILSIDKALELLHVVLSNLDEPIADSSLTPTYLLSLFTKKSVTVALSGDGGDELFAGYDPFQALPFAIWYTRIIPQKLHRFLENSVGNMPVSLRNMSLDFKIKRTLRGLGFYKRFWLPVWMSPLSPGEISELFDEPIDIEEIYSEALEQWDNCSSSNIIDKALQYYTKLYLQDNILVKADRASMLSSLEVRAPFLDIELVDFVRRIPASYKFRHGVSKYILKKSMEDILPKNILYRPKKGFGAPVGKWFQNQEISVTIDKRLPLNGSFISRKINDHVNRVTNDGFFLWALKTLNSYEL